MAIALKRASVQLKYLALPRLVAGTVTEVPLIWLPFSVMYPLSVPGVVSENGYCATEPSGSLALISDVKVIVWLVAGEILLSLHDALPILTATLIVVVR